MSTTCQTGRTESCCRSVPAGRAAHLLQDYRVQHRSQIHRARLRLAIARRRSLSARRSRSATRAAFHLAVPPPPPPLPLPRPFRKSALRPRSSVIGRAADTSRTSRHVTSAAEIGDQPRRLDRALRLLPRSLPLVRARPSRSVKRARSSLTGGSEQRLVHSCVGARRLFGFLSPPPFFPLSLRPPPPRHRPRAPFHTFCIFALRSLLHASRVPSDRGLSQSLLAKGRRWCRGSSAF